MKHRSLKIEQKKNKIPNENQIDSIMINTCTRELRTTGLQHASK